MTFFWIALIGSVLGILSIEWFFWSVFRMRMAGLHFPGVAGPVSRIAGLGRVRIFAILHTSILLCMTIFSLILLW